MKKRVMILGIAAVAGVLILGISSADTRDVVWTPPTLSTTAVNGVTSTTSVSFISNKNLNLVRATVDDTLKPYVSVSPSSLGKVKKGQQVFLTLTLTAASGTPPHVISGELMLFKDNGAAKAFGSLPISISLEPVVLPPDPGDAGKATLEGIDSDHDGIRDDIQRYIAVTYWNKPEIAAGLRQFAKPLEQALLGSNNYAEALVHANDIGRSFSCIEFRSDGQNEVQKVQVMDQITDDLLARMLNTDQRSKAYIAYDRQLGGHIFPGLPLPNQSACRTSNEGGN